MKPSITILFIEEGKVSPGTGQQILFADFDHRLRNRKRAGQVIGTSYRDVLLATPPHADDYSIGWADLFARAAVDAIR